MISLCGMLAAVGLFLPFHCTWAIVCDVLWDVLESGK